MTTKTQIRPIVKAAFKCDALEHQFTQLDIEDGLLVTGSEAEVNDKYDDAHIIDEAENLLDICTDPCNSKDPVYIREARQLRAFIKRFKQAAA